MEHELNYIADLKQFSEWIDGNRKWVQLYPYDSWDHPFYSTTTITPEVARKFVENFDKKIRGQEIHSSYEHGLDPAKGTKASGKFIKVEARDDGPWALVEFTDEAKKEIDAGEWNYWSTEHFDSWTHPQTKETHDYVLAGGGLTNNPFVKDMVPLNFSELILADPELKMHSLLSSAERDNLPDSSFAYIEPGGQKDAEGKTVPRSKRHLPYKTVDGHIDLPHVRNALARLSGTHIPESEKPGIMDKLHRYLSKQYSEQATSVLDALEALPAEQFIVDDDSFFDEVLETTNDETTATATTTDTDTNSNNETNEDGMDELLKKFSELFGLPEDSSEEDVVAFAAKMKEDIEPLRELQQEQETRKAFSEQYPDEARELEENRKYRQEQEAKSFSEHLAARRVTNAGKNEDDEDITTNTTLGFSALVCETAADVIKKFSERTVTVDDFKAFAESVLNNGIVDYGTRGSSREDNDDTDTNTAKPVNVNSSPQDIRKQFSELVDKVQADNAEFDYATAYAKAAADNPELFDLYKNKRPVINADGSN